MWRRIGGCGVDNAVAPTVTFATAMIAARPTASLLCLLVSAVAGLPQALVAQSPPAAEYRRHALANQGDAERGAGLFNEARLSCHVCHTVDGSAGRAGPDLFAAGDAFGRRDLIDALLEPSANIAPGYGTVIVATKDGASFQGVLKGSTADQLQLMGPDGKLIEIPAAAIKQRSGTAVSLMPEGLHTGLTPAEFTDLIEYLTTLKQPASTLGSLRGMPLELPALGNPVRVLPFFNKEFTLPRSGPEAGLTSFRQIPGAGETYLVLHQKGMIWKVAKHAGAEEVSTFADLRGEVFSERGPNGLLDVAFHPEFKTNRKYYLFYQIFEGGKVVSQIVEREFDPGGSEDSGKTSRVLLKIISVAEDHSGGCVQFGPDGFLYIVMGDTGPHNDPGGHSQNGALLLGKLLRIDVDGGQPYAIPADNPFVGDPLVRPEIWASGFRNPWRFSFDRSTGDLWLADVGQDRVEEVAIVKRGENHGWNVYEGFEAFSNQYRKATETYTMPVFSYRRKYGNSVTGGHVYRGDENSGFQGVYVCGDYTSKLLFGLTLKDGVLEKARVIGEVPQRIASFSEDEAGNLFAVGFEGRIYRIEFADAVFQ
jgi:putative heme-binding domain-containing protein